MCDKVIIGEDKSATIVRIIDTIAFHEGIPHKTGDLFELSDLRLFVSIKRGDATGKLQLLVTCVDPSGERTPTGMVSHEADGGPESGANVVGPVRFRWAGEGLYWLELNAGRATIARTPIRLNIQKSPVPEAKAVKTKKV